MLGKVVVMAAAIKEVLLYSNKILYSVSLFVFNNSKPVQVIFKTKSYQHNQFKTFSVRAITIWLGFCLK